MPCAERSAATRSAARHGGARLARMAPLLLAPALLGGCASIISGTSDQVFVDTPGVQLANCQILTENGPVAVQTPGQVRIPRRNDDVLVRCSKPGYNDGTNVADSGFELWTLGNLLFGGIIGFGVDLATGAVNDYPGRITVVLTPKPGQQDRPGEAPGMPNAALPPSAYAPQYRQEPIPPMQTTTTSALPPLPPAPMPQAPMAAGSAFAAPAASGSNAALMAVYEKTQAALEATQEALRVTREVQDRGPATRQRGGAVAAPSSRRGEIESPYLRASTGGEAAAPAPSAPAVTGTGSYAVQVASFLDLAQAEAGWASFTQRNGDITSGREKIIRQATVNGRTYYRVYAGSSSREDADQLCRSIRARNVNCIVSRL